MPMCLIAFFLSLYGVTHIQFGNDYYTFMGQVSSTYESWAFEIPDIPKIPEIDKGDYDKGGLILAVLIKIANFFVKFVNIITTIINIITSILNIVIQVIQFILSLIYECRGFLNKFRTSIASV